MGGGGLFSDRSQDSSVAESENGERQHEFDEESEDAESAADFRIPGKFPAEFPAQKRGFVLKIDRPFSEGLTPDEGKAREAGCQPYASQYQSHFFIAPVISRFPLDMLVS